MPTLKKLTKTVKESSVESYLVKRIKSIGGVAYKFTSPSRRSVPDRICLLPGGFTLFVECKSPGKKLTPAQEHEFAFLHSLGFAAAVVDSKKAINELIGLLKKEGA